MSFPFRNFPKYFHILNTFYRFLFSLSCSFFTKLYFSPAAFFRSSSIDFIRITKSGHPNSINCLSNTLQLYQPCCFYTHAFYCSIHFLILDAYPPVNLSLVTHYVLTLSWSSSCCFIPSSVTTTTTSVPVPITASLHILLLVLLFITVPSAFLPLKLHYIASSAAPPSRLAPQKPPFRSFFWVHHLIIYRFCLNASLKLI